jgi:hypothetical protein
VLPHYHNARACRPADQLVWYIKLTVSFFCCADFLLRRAMFDGGAVFARTAHSRVATAGSSEMLQVHLSRTSLLSNVASRGDGGGVAVDGGRLVIESGTKFVSNSAAADGGGFAIYAISHNKSANTLQTGCAADQQPGMAVLVISQKDASFEANNATRAGGAGFIGDNVHCNTTAVLSLRNANAVAPNTAASSNLIQAPGTCDAGFYWTSAGVCVWCPYGTYRLLNATHTDDVECRPCPAEPGYDCPGGDVVRPLPHYWMPDYTHADYASKFSATPPEMKWCPDFRACPGCSFGCSPGYQGLLCSQCEAGFSSPTPFKCMPCGNTAARNFALSTIGAVYVVWLAAWHSTPECFFYVGDVLKQLVWFFQVLVIVGKSSEFAWAPLAKTLFNWLTLGFEQGELGAVPAMQCLFGSA